MKSQKIIGISDWVLAPIVALFLGLSAFLKLSQHETALAQTLIWTTAVLRFPEVHQRLLISPDKKLNN